MKRNLKPLAALAAFGFGFGFVAAAASAATVNVDCDAGGKIAEALSSAKSGDTVAVTGICKESVLILPHMTGITLDGQGKATLQGPPHDVAPTKPSDFTVFVLGKDIRIKGFTILGGSHAVHLSGPATVVVEGNVIRNSGGAIHLDKGSIGTIFNNTIENNHGYGINLIENSYARIGFRIPTLPTPQANIIRNNAGPGIIVGRWSSAWVVGNQIENNKGHGVIVDRNSQADVVANSISGNTGDGIHATHNGGVNFDSQGFDLVINSPNQSATPNGGVGVSCSIGGYVSGVLGKLSGQAGAKKIDAGCVDAVTMK